MGKQCKVQFKTSIHKIEGILDFVHYDIQGLSKFVSKGGSLYYMSFIDDYSRKVWVYFLMNKYDAFAKFKKWKAEAENQIGRKVKCRRID